MARLDDNCRESQAAYANDHMEPRTATDQDHDLILQLTTGSNMTSPALTHPESINGTNSAIPVVRVGVGCIIKSSQHPGQCSSIACLINVTMSCDWYMSFGLLY